MSSSAARRWAERHARRTTRSEPGPSSASASRRSAIGCGSVAPKSRSSRASSGSRTRRLASTSSATWRSATSRSACRFSIRKKPFERSRDARGRIDLARAQPREQRLGREVEEDDLVGRRQHGVGHGLADPDAGQLGDLVVEALEVLDVHGREDVDAGSQQIGDVLEALVVLGARGVGVRELVDERELGRAAQHGGEVHLLQDDAAALDPPSRHDLQAGRLRGRLVAPVGLDQADHDVAARVSLRAAVLEHAERLADACRHPEEDLVTTHPRRILT